MFAFTNRQIEIFLTVCEVGSFRQAAERIGISEAGVSHHIRALERQLDCPLFSRRRGARIELIQAGHAFREEALTFVDRGRELRAVAARHARQSPPLRAFVGGHLLEDFVRPALPRLAREHPEINLRFEVNRSRYQVRRQILAGEFDAVLLAVRDADEMPGSVLLSQVESGIYGTPRYAAQALREGLAALPFILSPAGSDDERAERRSLEKLGIAQPVVALRTQFHDGKIRSAVDDQGETMTLESIVTAFDPGDRLCLIHRLGPWQRRLFLNEALPPETKAVLTRFFQAVLDGKTSSQAASLTSDRNSQ
jgi:DNA-binding transcriptional LysR family regulator